LLGRSSASKDVELLVSLLALGQLATEGTSALEWSAVETKLANLIRDYGPPSSTTGPQSAACPFTRLRSDGLRALNHDVDMDRVRPLAEHQVIGRLESSLEDALGDPDIAAAAARQLVDAEFPPTIAPDVLIAVGLDPDTVLGTGMTAASRRRNSTWPAMVLAAWDRQCAFCGFDGQLGSASVGIEAAHIRWLADVCSIQRQPILDGLINQHHWAA
jgi:putative restriction endonuclease